MTVQTALQHSLYHNLKLHGILIQVLSIIICHVISPARATLQYTTTVQYFPFPN